jgi:hypothetical protein
MLPRISKSMCLHGLSDFALSMDLMSNNVRLTNPDL